MLDEKLLRKLLDAQKTINEAVFSLTSTKNGQNGIKDNSSGEIYECPETPEGHDPAVFQNAYMDLMISRKPFEQNNFQRGTVAEPFRKEEPPMPTCPKLTRGCLSLRKDGRWMVRYRSADGHQRAVYERSKYDVIVKANGAIRADDKNAANPVVSGRMVLASGFDWWIEQKKGFVHKSTIVMYDIWFSRYIRNTDFAKKRVSDIMPSDIQTAIQMINAPSARHDVFLILNMMFESLYQNGATKRNPAAGVQNKPKRPQAKKKQSFSSKQINPFLQNVLEKYPEVGIYVIVLAATGMRKGEALALEWPDIDFKKKQIHVTKQWNSTTKKIDILKTEASKRDVPLLPKAEAILLAHRGKTGPIFKDIYPSTISTNFVNYAKAFGLPGLTLHGLRRYFISECHKIGVDVIAVKDVVGHTNASTTLDVYTGLDDETKLGELEKMTRVGLNDA